MKESFPAPDVGARVQWLVQTAELTTPKYIENLKDEKKHDIAKLITSAFVDVLELPYSDRVQLFEQLDEVYAQFLVKTPPEQVEANRDISALVVKGFMQMSDATGERELSNYYSLQAVSKTYLREEFLENYGIKSVNSAMLTSDKVAISEAVGHVTTPRSIREQQNLFELLGKALRGEEVPFVSADETSITYKVITYLGLSNILEK